MGSPRSYKAVKSLIEEGGEENHLKTKKYVEVNTLGVVQKTDSRYLAR